MKPLTIPFQAGLMAAVLSALLGAILAWVSARHVSDALEEDVDRQLIVLFKRRAAQPERTGLETLPEETVNVSGVTTTVRWLAFSHATKQPRWIDESDLLYRKIGYAEGGRFRTVLYEGEWWRVAGFRLGDWQMKLAVPAEEIVSEGTVAATVTGLLALAGSVGIGGMVSWWTRRREELWQQRLDTAEAEWRRFGAEASHELRTPLAILQGRIETFIGEPGVPDRDLERFEALLSQTKRLRDTLLALHLMHEAEAGPLTEPGPPADMAQIAREAVDDIVLEFGERLRIDWTPPEHPSWVRAKPDWLRIVVANLLSNAVRHNFPDGGFVKVRLTGTTLDVENSGPPIFGDECVRVFEPFIRGAGARQQGVAGQGLGLSLARALARALGGELVLVSSDERSTRFRFYLPPAKMTNLSSS